MKYTTNLHFIDEFSSIFDSVYSNSGMEAQAIVESNIINSIITLQAPVLSLPQMIDNISILRLHENEFFITLLRKGIVSTSLYGNLIKSKTPLIDFTISRLENEQYIFSSMPFINKIGSEFSSTTRKAIISKLRSNDNYPAELNQYRDTMDLFVDAIKKYDNAINTLDDKDMSNWRTNFTDEKNIISMKQYTNMSIDYVKEVQDDAEKQGIQFPQLFDYWNKLVDEASQSKTGGNDRIDYYRPIESWVESGYISHKIEKELRELVDSIYNRSMATRIAYLHQIKTAKTAIVANAIKEKFPTSKKSDNINIEERKDRLYIDEVKNIIINKETPSWTKRNIVSWDKLLHIVNDIEKVAEKYNNPDDDKFINDIMDLYKSGYSQTNVSRDKYDLNMEDSIIKASNSQTYERKEISIVDGKSSTTDTALHTESGKT